MIINIHEAKTHFSKLIERVRQGEEIIIAKAGVPSAKIVPIVEKKNHRKPGTLQGKIKISVDFDAPLSDEILDDFERE
jgi:prevent-host-death family protein